MAGGTTACKYAGMSQWMNTASAVSPAPPCFNQPAPNAAKVPLHKIFWILQVPCLKYQEKYKPNTKNSNQND